MKPSARLIPCMALVALALAVTSCGSTPLPVSAAADTPVGNATNGQTAAQDLATIRIGPAVTEASLLASLPGAQVLSFDQASGYAVVALPASHSMRAASLVSGNLRALDASLITLEPDAEVAVQGEDDAEAEALGITSWAGGITSWAGGITSWAGGITSWAGGVTFTNAATNTAAQAYWKRIGLVQAQTLVPEQGAGIKVAVIDTGIDLNHPLLQGRLDTANGWDYIGNDATPQEEQASSGPSKYGHGTAVAGVILQIAPNAKVIAYRVLRPDGSGPLSNVIQAISKATGSGAQVINLSLGNTVDSKALNTVIAAALAKGILVVNSSGNAGAQGMVYPSRNVGTAAFPQGGGLIAVGSVNLDLKKSGFTSYGKNMSLSAPGENIVTIFPDGRLVMASGTSFAAPAVSGALALALSTGKAQPAGLGATLESSTTPNADPTYNAEMGTGTLNVYTLVRNYR